MSNFAKLPVRRAAIGLSILSMLAAAGCAATASDSGMPMQDRPMAGTTMPHAAQGGGMMGQDHAMPPGMNMPRTAFSEAEMSMHRSMMMATDVNTQRTWARKMIAHHRGGIAMSQALLASDATDVEARRMAQAVIDAQTREVAELESWLERHPG
jgi:uncharacterized protein (DUF305 family)